MSLDRFGGIEIVKESKFTNLVNRFRRQLAVMLELYVFNKLGYARKQQVPAREGWLQLTEQGIRLELNLVGDSARGTDLFNKVSNLLQANNVGGVALYTPEKITGWKKGTALAVFTVLDLTKDSDSDIINVDKENACHD